LALLLNTNAPPISRRLAARVERAEAVEPIIGGAGGRAMSDIDWEFETEAPGYRTPGADRRDRFGGRVRAQMHLPGSGAHGVWSWKVYFGDSPASAMNEVHAHTMTQAQCGEFNLSWSEILEIESRQQQYMQQINEFYRNK
jgi:hypothetical protein